MDGHVVTGARSRIRFDSTLEATRATQLYRTLPHQIGHLVDYNVSVPEPDKAGISGEQHLELFNRYWQRPERQNEEFAHRYADELRKHLAASGRIPFPRIESWESDGLREADFAWPPRIRA